MGERGEGEGKEESIIAFLFIFKELRGGLMFLIKSEEESKSKNYIVKQFKDYVLKFLKYL